MRRRFKAGGFIASTLVLLSASAAYSIIDGANNPARACLATPTPDDGSSVSSVAVECEAGDESYTFGTKFEATVLGSQFYYDGAGADTIEINGGIIATPFSPMLSTDGTPILDFNVGESDDDFLWLLDGIYTFDGDDSFLMSAGELVQNPNDGVETLWVYLGDGDDLFEISGGSIDGSVSTGSGSDQIRLLGGVVTGDVYADEDSDNITVSDVIVDGSIYGGSGNDQVSLSDGSVGIGVWGDDGADSIVMSGGRVGAFLAGRDGNDVIRMSGGLVGDVPDSNGAQGLFGGRDDDTIEVSGGRILGGVYGDATEVGAPGSFSARDTIRISGGLIEGTVQGGLNNDSIFISSGEIVGNVYGDEPGDQGGDDVVQISGGSIGGDVLGGAGVDRLDLSSGTIAGAIRAFELIQFYGGSIGGDVILRGTSTSPSTLKIDGHQSIGGTLDARDGIVDMQDGAADDTLTLGGLTMRNSTIAVDVDQSSAMSDQISAANSDVSGPNFLNVSLLNTPNFTEETAIPIVVGGSLNASDFTVIGLPDDPASMFGFRLDQGADGGLVLYARPTNTTPATATQAAIDSRPVVTATDALNDVTKEAADNGLGLGSSSQALIAPSFGVFSTGQFGRTDHDGFKVYNPSFVGSGPSFTADDFSAAISLDFNAGEHFGLGENVGLNLGLFGGYATSDVTLDAYQQFSSSIGEAKNESVLVGGYGLFRQGYNYALVSGTAFIGQTDVTNYAVGSSASYDTVGYAVTASAGRIFMLNDRVKFDLRGGVLGATFEGDSYTDSKGVKFGKSKVSFGAVKFEPGIYADYQWENGMVFTPYARLDIQQRFGYENSANLGGQDFDFEDDDFSAAISSGFNVRMSQHATLSAEVRGKLSGDSSTIAGKLGLKVGF